MLRIKNIFDQFMKDNVSRWCFKRKNYCPPRRSESL